MRAVIYTRVSTLEQTKNLSLEVQEQHCRKYCKDHDLEIAEVFVDRGESAKTTQRTEFLKLLRYCQQARGKIQYLVVYALSRFSRNTGDHHTVRALLAGFGFLSAIFGVFEAYSEHGAHEQAGGAIGSLGVPPSHDTRQ